ncbi:STAS domain-containing protein [Butyrivibrio sp. AE2032]|jgi:anti-sigma B factor antagonist|uniref:STAS domain-containing protein n=1 Tax=Butyrivibrio sp. AE2032 TaxID=1458463 RepID=UPI0005586150|nr:STAS domain-containing protein [Butyrivibrio sp. AE2032]
MADIKKEISGTTMNIALGGILDTKSAPQLQDAIMESVADVTEINIDMAQLEYLTSAGLRAILVAQQEMDDKDGKMTLKHVAKEIIDIFKMTGFLSILTIED